MKDDMLISTREAAVLLGLSTDGVLHLVRSGRLTPATPVKPRQSTYFRRADVERLAEERRGEKQDSARAE